MERLTERGSEYVKIKGNTTLFSDTERYRAYLNNAIIRLARYEDTGLEPEEIQELLHQSYGPLHKKLGEWISADRDGRLVIEPPNTPLTLDELREMDGEPVYIILNANGYNEIRAWGIVDTECEKVAGNSMFLPFEDYGAWVAYRRKPEEGTA